MRLVAKLRHPELVQSGDNMPPPISRSAPVAAFSIMSTRSVFIGSALTLIRTLRLSDMDPTMPKNDRGASMLRKRSRQEESAGLSGKSLGSERYVSRSREPSLHSRGDSSVRADTSVYVPAHQRDRPIGESNSDSRRKEYYDRRREAESSRDHGHDYTKDRDRSKDYDKDKDRDRHK